MPLLITNATLVTHTDAGILENRALYIELNTITEIGPTAELSQKYPDAETIDANGAFVMPGNICAHTHFYGAFARGMPIPGVPPKDFPEILQKLWWPLDEALDENTVRLSVLVSLVDAIKHGTTCLFDHHASPNFISGSLDVIADAVAQSGLRAVLCYEVTDRGGEEKMQAGIEENVRFMQAVQQYDRIAGTFGLHASLTLSEETLERCVAASDRFHIHVAEHEVDEYDSVQQYGERVVQRLARHGVLGEQTIVAHGVHCDAWELELLRDSGTWVTHQPRSNMNNGVGAAPIDTMLRADMNLCLGSDGFFGPTWEDWKAAYLLQKVAHRDPRLASGDGIAKMAWENNARLASQFFPDYPVGQLKAGAAADIIILDYAPFTPVTDGNLPWHVIFGFEASLVRTTIAGGQVLMRDRELITLDEKSIAEEGMAAAPELWKRYQELASRED